MKTTRTLSLALALLLPAVASAAPNEGVMTYSGYLHTSAGNPETGVQSLTFTLYDGPSTGNTVWTQTVTGVQPDAQGWFSVVLGASPAAFPPGEFLNQTWLGIKVGSEAEMTPRTKMGAAPHALSVDYSGLSGCTSPNQVLQWNGTAWACIATPTGGGGGGVTSIAIATGTPITVAGTTAVTLAMSPASATANGFLSSADWSTFNAKAPTANPTFTGTVTAPTFVGALSGNATSATTAGSATTATTATTANAVAANAVTPSDLNTATIPSAGQVPARGATDTFTWVTPTTYAAGTGLTLTGTTFAVNATTVQTRVGAACAAGSAIRAIAADGTVTCDLPGTALRYIPIDAQAANIGGAATRSIGFGPGLTGAILMPNAGVPSVNLAFIVPADYVAGTAISLDIIWKANTMTAAGTAVNLRNNWGGMQRPGLNAQAFNAGDPTPVTVTAAQLVVVSTITISDGTTPFAPKAGDAVNYGFFRSAGTATDDIVVGGLRVSYTAQK